MILRDASLTSIGKPPNFLAWMFRSSSTLGIKIDYPDDLGSPTSSRTHSIKTANRTPTSPVFSGKTAFTTASYTAEAMKDSDGKIVQRHGLSLDIDEPKRAQRTGSRQHRG